jgi:hypothetical protein
MRVFEIDNWHALRKQCWEKHEAGDMTANEGDEGGIWKWIGILVIAAGVMFLICSIVAFIAWCLSRRS